MTGRDRNAVGHAGSLGGTTDQMAEVNFGVTLCPPLRPGVLAAWREIAFSANSLTQSRQAAKKNRKVRLPGLKDSTDRLNPV